MSPEVQSGAIIPERYRRDRLEWLGPLPRELVHQTIDDHVLITGICPAANGSFLLGSRWPAGHGFAQRQGGGHDPMLVAETFRQAGVVVAHVGLGLALGSQCVMAEFAFGFPAADVIPKEPEPAGLVRVDCTDLVTRDGCLRRVRYEMSMSCGPGQPAFACCRALLVCLPAELYRRIRRTAPAADPGEGRGERWVPLEAAALGKSDPRDVLLADTGGSSAGTQRRSWAVRLDARHPALCDHPVDHVPGMLQLEVFRQAALALALGAPGGKEARFLGCEAQFRRVVDLGVPLRCSAERAEGQAVRVACYTDPAAAYTTGVVYLA